MALSGDLSEFPLTDIIQLLDLSKKTGALHIDGYRGQQRLEGWLYFRDGKIIDASLENLAPLEAAYTCFTFSSGPFQLHDNVLPKAVRISQSNEMIIMEGIMHQETWASSGDDSSNILSMVPRLVPNPTTTGSEISLESDEWRVLTMVSGKMTVARIAQRSGLGDIRTTEIVQRLLSNGLIEKREVTFAEMLFPDLERIVLSTLGPSARVLLYDAYSRAGISDQNTATPEQISSALEMFEMLAARAFGLPKVRQPLEEMRNHMQQVLSSASRTLSH